MCILILDHSNTPKPNMITNDPVSSISMMFDISNDISSSQNYSFFSDDSRVYSSISQTKNCRNFQPDLKLNF